MENYDYIKPVINKAFKNQLITGILSSPVLYIHHTHARLVDDALLSILTPNKYGNTLLGLAVNSILQFGHNSVVDFITKQSYDAKKEVHKSEKNTIDSFSKKKSVDNEFSEQLKTLRTANAILNNLLLLSREDQIGESQDAVSKKRLFLFTDMTNFMSNNDILPKLASFVNRYERGFYERETTIIIVSPEPLDSFPVEFQNIVKLIEIPAPSESEIKEMTDGIPISNQYINQEQELRKDLCRTLLGLQVYEILDIMRASIVRTGYRLTEQTIRLALEEKKNIVKKSGIIEVIDSDIDFSQVGGLENLQEDLKRKAALFRNLNVLKNIRFPYPKGVLVLGMPGCGKSMIAKSIANEFGVSLLRLDVNRLMGQYVGQSEANLRKALATAEAAHPCILWIDEIEKAFAGSNGQNNDMLVMRLMGAFLTWMQERKTAVYIVATANDVMRPEFMRKGRFDEVYFVDFPKEKERAEIFKKKIEFYKTSTREQDIFDFADIDKNVETIVKEMEGKYGGFSGAEIECVVNSVIEKYLIEYLSKKENNDDKIKIQPIKLEVSEFERVVAMLKPSVMSNQEGKEENGVKTKTSIERIRDLQEIYKFRNASAEKNETDNTSK